MTIKTEMSFKCFSNAKYELRGFDYSGLMWGVMCTHRFY